MKERIALKYINTNKKGSLKELEKNLEQSIISDFKLTNLIKINKESWGITREAIDIYNLTQNYKPSFFQKIQSFLNKKVSNI